MAEQPTPIPGENPTKPVPNTEAPAPVSTAPPAAPPKLTPPAITPDAPPLVPVAPEADPVPEKYTLFAEPNKPVIASLIDAVTPIFKDAKLTGKTAQKLVDAFETHRKAMIPLNAARDLDALRTDPQLGQLNFGRTQQRIKDALAAFSTPEERHALTALGIDNNPALVRMFHRIGTAMQEPGETPSGGHVRAPRTAASKLYGGGDLVASAKPN